MSRKGEILGKHSERSIIGNAAKSQAARNPIVEMFKFALLFRGVLRGCSLNKVARFFNSVCIIINSAAIVASNLIVRGSDFNSVQFSLQIVACNWATCKGVARASNVGCREPGCADGL